MGKVISSDRSAFFCAHSGTMDFIVPFLQAGAPIDVVDTDGNTLLHVAASGWQYRMAEFLLISGVPVNAQNNLGQSALHKLVAAQKVPLKGTFLHSEEPSEARRKTFAELLLRGCDTALKDAGGVTALHRAAYAGDLQAIQQLASRKSMKDVSPKGLSALAIAVLNEQADCARFLIRAGSDLELQIEGLGSVHELVLSSENPAIRELLQGNS